MMAVELDGTRINTYRGRSVVQAVASARRYGIGDVAVRAKFRAIDAASGGLAVLGELRLPTGREEDLLGAGRTVLKVALVASGETPRAGVHGNVALGVGGVSREESFAGGVSLAAGPRVTLTGELLGQRLPGLRTVAETTAPHPRIAGVRTLGLGLGDDAARALFAVAGAKWNVSSTWLVSANVRWPLSDAGLRSRPAPTVGVDYAF